MFPRMNPRISRFLSTSASVVLLLALGACSSVGPDYPSIREAMPDQIEARVQQFENAETLYGQIERRPSVATLSQYNAELQALLEDQFGRRGRLREAPASWGKWVVDEPQCIDPLSLKSLFPASLINTDGVLKDAREIEGIGVPLVGWVETETPSDPATGFLPPTGIARSLTAVLSFNNGQREWRLYDRYDIDEIEVGGQPLKLAADFSAAIAVFEDRSELSDFGLFELLLPERFYKETGIFAAGDYDPGKIPVVFIHGVNSNPFTFVEMVDQLALERDIRANFQFYFFYYPTGGGWLFTAPEFRESVRALRHTYDPEKNDTGFENMVVLAHSMGGLITRASVSSNPEVIYNAWFERPVDELRGSERNRELVRETFAYEPLGGVTRVVFMATPHRGSEIADMRIITLISRLIKLPVGLTSNVLEAFRETGLNLLEGNLDNFKLPTSIDELSPNNRTIRAVSSLNFHDNVKVHSIIGAKGGDPKSDGIVPYWSSHIDAAQTELIIESNHSVPRKLAAADEVLRILREHLAASKQSQE